MQTTYIGQLKVIKRGERIYKMTDESLNAAAQLDWAEKILAAPCVTYQNGRISHEVANEVAERYEDVLIDHLLVTA